jgi:hypothetical protein
MANFILPEYRYRKKQQGEEFIATLCHVADDDNR